MKQITQIFLEGGSLTLKYLKMIAIMPFRGKRSSGKDVDKYICITTLNMGIMRGRSNEIVKMLSRSLIDISCLQESR